MKVLITGGAGFIGCNIAKRLMDEGNEIIVFDNLCRKGSEVNLKWLRSQGDLVFIKGDLRNYSDIKNVFDEHKKIGLVLHLAAQVAVTSSVSNPREDFEINALGTLNLLEAIRNSQVDPILFYTSTNKVYGRMEDVQVRVKGERYEYEGFPQGIAEDRPLDFHSPYGCSKGCAEQYVRDYSRIYGLRSLVFRMSCIYGLHQFGVEDQGWVAWFTIASVLGLPITIYGDGKQVRDILYIEDLIEAILKAVEKIDATKGKIYNIGGGFQNCLSLLELVHYLEELENFLPDELLDRISFSKWRPGDQPVFICDISKAKRDFAWEPLWSTKEGIRQLYEWIIENKSIIKEVIG